MRRVCGAIVEASPAQRAACWCHGLFCGRGGGRLSQRLWRDLHVQATAATRAQFNDLCKQNDLFDGTKIVDFWTALVDGPRAAVREPRAS